MISSLAVDPLIGSGWINLLIYDNSMVFGCYSELNIIGFSYCIMTNRV